MARLIGITGGIGSGKSVVSRFLRCRGYEVYDCDSRAKALMEQSVRLKHLLCGRFGEECLLADGKIDRVYLARRVFSEDTHRLWLNSQVHCMVREDIARIADESAAGIWFVESAILKSSGLDKMCDEIWLVDAPLEIRLRRVESRDGTDREQVLLRMNAQQHEFEALDATVHKIRNYGSDSLTFQIDKLLARLA